MKREISLIFDFFFSASARPRVSWHATNTNTNQHTTNTQPIPTHNQHHLIRSMSSSNPPTSSPSSSSSTPQPSQPPQSSQSLQPPSTSSSSQTTTQTTSSSSNQYFKSLAIKEYEGHKKKVHSVAWSSDGQRLASGSIDRTVRIWHVDPKGTLVRGSVFCVVDDAEWSRVKSPSLIGKKKSYHPFRFPIMNLEVTQIV